jgi:peptidoglycan hydrolase-like protein with peptidoglycan-binding domain
VGNAGWPEVKLGDSGDAVRQAQRGLRRTPNTSLVVDGEFGPLPEAATKEFQQSVSLSPTGIVNEATRKLLPNGNPMPTLQEGSTGEAVRALQEVLTRSAFGLWEVTPKGIDGKLGPNTAASVRAFQKWARLEQDAIVGTRSDRYSADSSLAVSRRAVAEMVRTGRSTRPHRSAGDPHHQQPHPAERKGPNGPPDPVAHGTDQWHVQG